MHMNLVIALIFGSLFPLAANCTTAIDNEPPALSSESICASLTNRNIESRYLISLQAIKKIPQLRERSLYIEEQIHCPAVRLLLRLFMADEYSDYNLETAFFHDDLEIIEATEFEILILSKLADTYLNHNSSHSARATADKAFGAIRLEENDSGVFYSAVFVLGKVYAKLGDKERAYEVANTLPKNENGSLITAIDRITARVEMNNDRRP